jgi:hypothetical protein
MHPSKLSAQFMYVALDRGNVSNQNLRPEFVVDNTYPINQWVREKSFPELYKQLFINVFA